MGDSKGESRKILGGRNSGVGGLLGLARRRVVEWVITVLSTGGAEMAAAITRFDFILRVIAEGQ